MLLTLSSPGLAVAQPAQTPAPPQPPSAAPLPVATQTPEPGKLIAERRPVVTLTFADPAAVDPKSVVLEVDAVDVTMLTTIENGKVIYIPPTDLKHGEHTVKLSASAKDGAALQPVEWKFKIRRFAWLEDAKLGGDLSSTYEHAIRRTKPVPPSDSGVSKKTATPADNLQNNLSTHGLLKEGEFTAKLDSNVRYADEFRPPPRAHADNPKLDLANFLISLDRKPGLLELGDVSINEGFFGAPTLGRRGMHLKFDEMQTYGLQLHTFATRFETTKGHDPFFGPEDPDSVLWGAALTLAPFQDRELFKVEGMRISGHRFSTSPGTNVGTIVSGEQGNLTSVGTSSTLLKGKLRILTELAFSDYDTNTVDQFKARDDHAYRTRIEGTQDVGVLLGSPVSLKPAAEYSYVGLFFRSPANPGLQPDRYGYNVKTDAAWKISTLSLGYATFQDNTELLKTLPRVRTHVLDTTLALAPPNLPTANLTYNRSDQRSFYEPQEHLTKGVDNVQNTYGVNLTYGKDQWSVNWGATLNRFHDIRPIGVTTPGGDKNTWTTQSGVMLKPIPTLSIGPNFNYTLIDEKQKNEVLPNGDQAQQRVRTETFTGTLAAAQEFIPKILNLDLQVSAAAARASDGSQDNQTYSGVSRLTWTVGKLFSDWGRQALSIRLNYSRVVDNVKSKTTEEIGVFLILDLLSPYNL